ncbi:MAG: Rid family detoxifying hydrolase [Ruminococcus sp.]|nr:Rid family detoxifying hydrolase [Candidatus Copronaster equi]MBQ0055664.1 Rid family detoxifying hydrolase [Candidatus Equadaptatus faecalis]
MYEKKQVVTGNAPSPAGPYSQAVDFGDYIFVAGQRPMDPVTGEIKQEIKAATEQCIKNVQAILKEAGADLEDIGKTTVFLADIKDFAAMNEVYTAMMPKPFPARSTIQVVLRGIPIEIEAIAKRKK